MSDNDEICQLLAKGQQLPTTPAGVRILEWTVPAPPIVISNFAVVNDVDKFARYTLERLGHAVAGSNWLAGNWSVPDLTERLERVGVKVDVNRTRQDAV